MAAEISAETLTGTPVRGRLPWPAGRLTRLLSATGPEQSWQSPFDPKLTTTLPTSTADDVVTAAERARSAQRAWAARPIDERADVLLAFHDLVLAHRDRLTDLLQYEGGKARLSAVEEVLHVALSARYYARTARRYLHDQRGSGLLPILTRIDRRYVPKGLVGVISPWNYPMTMAISDGLAALAAGNAVILKPDAQTPFCALAVVELLQLAGLPSDLWLVVHGPGGEVGPQLIAVSDYVCFTGSTRTGTSVARACAERLIGCSLELGGKNPLLVLADADVRTAASGAVRASFANAGQLCVASERLYVDQSVLEEFTVEFVTQTKALRLGYSLSFDHDVAGLINTAQLERVAAHVQDARDQGATVLAGGRRRPDLGPLFYEPTILTGVTDAMACAREETFGPVVSIVGVRDDEEAIARANDSAYGLNASVWTADPERGRRVAGRIHCGTVNVNDGFAATFGSLDAPMGGMKSSGIGRRQGREGILRFSEVQSVATQSLRLPIAPTKQLPVRRFVDLLTAGAKVFRKIGRP